MGSGAGVGSAAGASTGLVSSTGTTGAAAADSDIIEDLGVVSWRMGVIRSQTTGLQKGYPKTTKAQRGTMDTRRGRREDVEEERLTIVVYEKRARALWPCLLQGRRENEREREIGRE